MRKLITFLAILLLGTAAIAQDRSATLRLQTAKDFGETYKSITLGASDTIIASQTYFIEFTALKNYPSMQDFYIAGSAVSGSGNIVITAYGKKFSSDTYASIGTTTWNSALALDEMINVTTANRYRYFKISFVSDATTKKVLLTDVEFKMWFTGGEYSSTALTLSGAMTAASVISPLYDVAGAAGITFGSADATKFTFSGISEDLVLTPSLNTWTFSTSTGATSIAFGALNFTSVGTIGSGKVSSTGGVDLGSSQALTGTTAITVGSGTATTAITSSDWAIGASGIMTGMGAATFDGVVTATGGIVYPTVSTHLWTAGGAVVLATAGTDVACSNGDRYWSEIMIPYNVTLTGLSYLVGSVGATDSVVMQLFNSAGVEVATTKTAGATHGALVGTAAQFQSINFAASYAAVAGVYYVAVQFNGTTAKFRAYPIPGSTFVAGTVAGTWDTKADITPGTTFTASKGPIILTH